MTHDPLQLLCRETSKNGSVCARRQAIACQLVVRFGTISESQLVISSHGLIQKRINIQVREYAMKCRRSVVAIGLVLASGGLLGGCAAASKSSAAKGDPLTEFYGVQTPEKIQAMQTKAQKKTAECMRTQGFTYIPYTPPQSQMFNGPKPGEELDWKRKHGYGISDSMANMGEQRNQANADPNQALQEKMSEADRNEYQKALFGGPPAPGEENNFIPSGCMNAGYNGGNSKEMQALQQSMQPKYEALFKRIEADPRIVKVNLEWSICMRKKGHEGLKTEGDIYEKVLNPLQNKIFSSLGETPAPVSDAPPGPPKIDEKKLAELRKTEFALANDDADCSANKAKIRKTVNYEYQTKFLEQNRADLEKIKAAQGA
jgi:hypothetical protein